jgi:pullulanase/glycogen debranching enzyme
MKGIEPSSLSATLLSDNEIEITLKGVKKDENFTATTKDFTLTDAKGNIVPIGELKFDINATSKSENNPNKAIVIIAKPKPTIDKRRVYYLEMLSLKQKTLVTYDGWFKNLKSDKELGANVSSDAKQTSFRIFAPRATALKLYLYKDKDDSFSYDTIEMKMDDQGVWEAFVEGDLQGTWYDFTVHGSTDPGNSFYETHPVHISDPYARVSDDSFGKCMVAHKTIPASPLKNGRPKMENVMAYEVHVQDFTDLLPIGSDLKGTIPGMYQTGLKNSLGKKIGFDYLCELGINTIHIMPIQRNASLAKRRMGNSFC